MTADHNQTPAEAHGGEREAFEAWGRRQCWTMARDEANPERYHAWLANTSWLAWQARAALNVQPKGKVPDLYERLAEAHDASLDDDHRACRVILTECMSLLAAQAPAPVAGPLTAEECDRLLKSVRYMQGIAERGEGRPMRDDETVEDFVLGYVKRLEAVQAPAVVAVSLTDRERVLLDDLIRYWADHAKQCDGIQNRKMAERQKGWDLERVAMLRKLGGITAPEVDVPVQGSSQ